LSSSPFLPLFELTAPFFSTPILETSGIDTKVGYDFSIGDAGDIRTSMGLSYTLSYDLLTDMGVKIDVVGSRNNRNSVGYPLPEYKANFPLGWSRNRHAASAIVRHIAGYTDDAPQSALRGSFIGFAPEIDSMTTVDLQYNYQMPEFVFQRAGTVVTRGINKAANKRPPLVNTDGAFDPFTHDPRTRMFYAQ
jgi:hypothetical protein